MSKNRPGFQVPPPKCPSSGSRKPDRSATALQAGRNREGRDKVQASEPHGIIPSAALNVLSSYEQRRQQTGRR